MPTFRTIEEFVWMLEKIESDAKGVMVVVTRRHPKSFHYSRGMAVLAAHMLSIIRTSNIGIVIRPEDMKL